MINAATTTSMKPQILSPNLGYSQFEVFGETLASGAYKNMQRRAQVGGTLQKTLTTRRSSHRLPGRFPRSCETLIGPDATLSQGFAGEGLLKVCSAGAPLYEVWAFAG